VEEGVSEEWRGVWVLEGSRTDAGGLERLLGVAPWRALLGRDGEVLAVMEFGMDRSEGSRPPAGSGKKIRCAQGVNTFLCANILDTRRVA